MIKQGHQAVMSRPDPGFFTVKYAFLSIACFLFVLLPARAIAVPPVSSFAGDVVINEIHRGDDSEPSFVELYFNNDANIDDWTLISNGPGGAATASYPLSGSYNQGTFHVESGVYLDWHPQQLEVYLLDANGHLVHFVSMWHSGNQGNNGVYGNTTNIPSEVLTNLNPIGSQTNYCAGIDGHADRDDGQWSACEPTPGSSNSGDTDPVIELHHIRISHPATGLTCAPVTLVFTACADSTCDAHYDGGVDFDLQKNGSYYATISIPPGNSTTMSSLRHTLAGDVTLSLASVDYQCTETDCLITFLDSGFLLNMLESSPAYTAATGTIQAVKADPNDLQSCAVYDGFSGDYTLDFSFSYEAPTEGGRQPELNGVPLAEYDSTTPLILTFSEAQATADLSLDYEDAGRIALYARYTGNIGTEDEGLEMIHLVSAGNRETVFYPTALRVSTYTIAEDGTAEDPLDYGGSPDSSPVWVAGMPFHMLVEAGVDDAGSFLSTPNFNSSNIQVSTTWWDSSSTGWIDEGIVGVPSFDMLSGEHWLVNDDMPLQSISEVGAFVLSVDTPGDYLGIPLSLSASTTVGRFIPDHFTITTQIGFGCDDNNFTYAGITSEDSNVFTKEGEVFPLEFTLTARSALGNRTENYRDDFARGVSLTLGSWLDEDTQTSPEHGEFNLQSHDLPAADFINGAIEEKTLDLQYLFYAEGGPQEILVSFDAEEIEGDGVDGRLFDPDTAFRFLLGRLRLHNAHGPEILPLNMPVSIESYENGFYSPNKNDTCSMLTVADHIKLPDLVIDASPEELNFLGEGKLALSLSSDGATGSADVESNIVGEFPWLSYPWGCEDAEGEACARITFGIYQGSDRKIYMRERY